MAMLAAFFVSMSWVSKPLSACDVLIVIMVITHGCYYFWRWQDSRPDA